MLYVEANDDARRVAAHCPTDSTGMPHTREML